MKYRALVLLSVALAAGCSGPSGVLTVFDVTGGDAVVVKRPSSASEESILLPEDTDGRMVTMCVYDSSSELRYISRDGTVQETQTIDDADFTGLRVPNGAVLSPDGKTLVLFASFQNKLFEVNLATGSTNPLVKNLDWMLAGLYWGFDGAVWALVNDPYSEEAGGKVVRIDRAEKKVETVAAYAHFGGFHGTSLLSPDRRKLLVVAGGAFPAGESLRMLDLETRNEETLVEDQDGVFIHEPCWNQDQSAIAYMCDTRHEITEEERKGKMKRLSEQFGDKRPDQLNAEAMQAIADIAGQQFKFTRNITRFDLGTRSASTVLTLDDDVLSEGLAFLADDCIAVCGTTRKNESAGGREELRGSIIYIQDGMTRKESIDAMHFYNVFRLVAVDKGQKIACEGSCW